MTDEPPAAVLFACNYNRVRSPMAAGLLKLIFGARVFVDSCGLRRGDGVDPFVLVVMDEIGADLSDHQAKSFEDLEDGSYDVIVSLTPEAHHRAGEMARGRAVEIEYWPTLDPTLASGSRESLLEAYRAVRDGLRARMIERFGKPSTFGG